MAMVEKTDTNGATEARTESYQRRIEKMRRCLGEGVVAAFGDDDVTQVYVNPHDEWVRYDTKSRGKYRTEHRVTNQAMKLFLMAVAFHAGKRFGPDHPILEAELPDEVFGGARLEALHPPLVVGPAICVAKLPTRVHPLTEYVEQGVMTEEQRRIIVEAVTKEWNIIIAGNARAGKSTLMNAVIKEITDQFPNRRILIMEDVREIICEAEDHVKVRSGVGGFDRLIRPILRFDPVRLVTSEVRDGEIYPMLDAWSTGHPGGVCTVHGETASKALLRMARLAQSRESRLPRQEPFVAQVIDLVVMIRGSNEGRLVMEIVRVDGFRNGKYEFERVA